MARIAFFCIPAHGHVNPTLGLVRELCRRGHTVWYYHHTPFQAEIEAAGARFINCDDFGPPPASAANGSKIGLDMAASIQLLADTTLALDAPVTASLRELQPDLVVADSMATWGRFAAQKLGLPYVCSCTTFAFNRYSAKVLPQGGGSLWDLLKALPSVQRDIRRLRAAGYPVKSFLDLIANTAGTPTVVYTSPQFQPCADTFGPEYAFVGPVLRPCPAPWPKADGETLVYVALGTVNNRFPEFYRHCLAALGEAYRMVISAGEQTDLAALGPLPEGVTVLPFVDQLAVLQSADVFVTHCGMNSASEGLFYGVPLVLFPQTAEQNGVATRVEQLGAGVRLGAPTVEGIRAAVETVLNTPAYRQHAAAIGAGFRTAGGAAAAADAVERGLR